MCCFIFAVCAALINRRHGWIAAGLGFTVVADYFLVLRDAHFFGVAVFCSAHVCYILRGVNVRLWRVVALFFCVGAFILMCLFAQSIIFLAGLYALLFATNMYVNLRAYLHRPSRENMLMLAGLFLFALCDINVLLYNLPRYFGVLHELSGISFWLIWVFYLPSQALIAICCHFNKKKLEQKKNLCYILSG